MTGLPAEREDPGERHGLCQPGVQPPGFHGRHLGGQDLELEQQVPELGVAEEQVQEVLALQLPDELSDALLEPRAVPALPQLPLDVLYERLKGRLQALPDYGRRASASSRPFKLNLMMLTLGWLSSQQPEPPPNRSITTVLFSFL